MSLQRLFALNITGARHIKRPHAGAGLSSPGSSPAAGGEADAEDLDEEEDGAGDGRPMRCATALPPARIPLHRFVRFHMLVAAYVAPSAFSPGVKVFTVHANTLHSWDAMSGLAALKRTAVVGREPSSTPQPWQGPGAGSTAVAALVLGSTLYVANAGERGSCHETSGSSMSDLDALSVGSCTSLPHTLHGSSELTH